MNFPPVPNVESNPIAKEFAASEKQIEAAKPKCQMILERTFMRVVCVTLNQVLGSQQAIYIFVDSSVIGMRDVRDSRSKYMLIRRRAVRH